MAEEDSTQPGRTGGPGALFRFTVKLPSGDDRKSKAPGTHGSSFLLKEDYSSLLAKKRVLLVEDNAVNQMVAVAMLKKLGLSPDTASNGSEALETLVTRHYDLILMDIEMPEMDGIEAVRRIRSLPVENPNRTTPVIALTARAMRADREECLAAGMDDYVSKPVRPDTLKKTVERWLCGEAERE